MADYFKQKNQDEYKLVVSKLTANIKDNKLYNKVISFIQHDEWYTSQQINEVRELAKKYLHFSPKQREKLANPPAFRSNDDGLSYCLYNDQDGSLDIDRYQGHGEWDMTPGSYM